MTPLRHSTLDPRPSTRALPANISLHHSGGYIVRVTRHFIAYQAFTKSLAEATRLRDQFLARGGQVFRHPTVIVKKPRSNTGHVGISDMVKWVKYRPRYCFHITWQVRHRRRTHWIFYGPKSRTREQALSKAIQFRAAQFNNVPSASRRQSQLDPRPSTLAPAIPEATHA